MTEIHSKVHCVCGARYYHMFVQDISPKAQETIATQCPICGNHNEIAYEFNATCECGGFFLCHHFAKNEGSTNTEYFPRQCECGKEFIVQQRRTK